MARSISAARDVAGMTTASGADGIDGVGGTRTSCATGDTDADFERLSNDEVGNIAEAFTRMKTSLTIAMKRLEKNRTERRSIDNSQ